jgi:CRP-like cAMP-binding protein
MKDHPVNGRRTICLPAAKIPVCPLDTLFEGVAPEVRERLRCEGRRHQWKRHEHLYLAGMPATDLHVLLSGRLRDYYGDSAGNEHLRNIVMPGDITPFCHFCLTDRQHSSSCRALCCSVTFAFPAAVFLELAHDNSRLAVNLALAAARQLEYSCRNGCLCRKRQARCRVAGYLLSRLRRLPQNNPAAGSIDLRPLGVMAEELGLARETFSRLLMDFERQGLISNARGIITIHDQEALLAIATSDELLS